MSVPGLSYLERRRENDSGGDMFHPSRVIVALALALSLAPRASAQEVVRCAPLPLDKPVSAIALTEDGKQLVIAHEAENLLTIWDVAANKQVSSVSCVAPRYVICRGQHAYVASYDHGKVI